MAPFISIPDDGRDSGGFWGSHTGTIDFCEENYLVTPYIAEFWNTVSSLMMVVPPMIGFYQSRSTDFHKIQQLLYITLTIVGIGSWCFHCTLHYSMQLLDELPMTWVSTFAVYAYWQMESPPKQHNYPLAIGLCLYANIVTLIYLYWQEAVFHEVAFGFLVAVAIVLTIRINYKYGYATWLSVCSYSAYLLGFLFWNLDNFFCSTLRPFRSRRLYFLQPLLQGHLWWHVLAGGGAYLGIIYLIYCRRRFLRLPAKLKYLGHVLPYISVESTKTKQEQNGYANGHCNGDNNNVLYH